VLGAFAVALVKLIEVIPRIAKTEDMVEVISSRHHYTAKVKKSASFKWPMFFCVS
jgi:hypothetical protein